MPPVNAVSTAGSVLETGSAAASRAVDGCATELVPAKSSVPSNAASVCIGTRSIVPAIGGGDASPPGLENVTW